MRSHYQRILHESQILDTFRRIVYRANRQIYTRLIGTFDDLLALFQHPAFDSNKVTLRYTEDAFTRIAEQRKLDAKVSRMERHQDNDSCA